jgi:hypothetical protein
MVLDLAEPCDRQAGAIIRFLRRVIGVELTQIVADILLAMNTTCCKDHGALAVRGENQTVENGS